MHAYLVAVLLLGGLAPMALASHVHGRWIEPRAPDVPTLAVYFVVMGALAVLGLVLLGPRMLTDGGWLRTVSPAPLGWCLAAAAWRCDRWIVARYGGRKGWTAARPRGSRTAGPARPVGIAAADGAGLSPAEGVRPASVTNRWGRTERARETRVGLSWLVAGAVLEELVHRGALTRFAVDDVSWAYGIPLLAGAALAFALSHLPFGWVHALAKLPLSLMAVALTLATGGVVAAVVGHVWFNVRVHRHYRATFGGRRTAR
ncbi:CPBP family glutamic-type intramembrane protease [Streptomyces sp. NPDC002537]